MSAAKHTRGPWMISPLHGAQIAAHWNGAPRLIASAAMNLQWHEDIASEAREVGANARLIAAAPDLLAALIELRKQINDFCIQYGEADFYTGDATKAIAKATGSGQ